MRILLIDNYDSFTYNLAQLLEESRLCDFEIKKNDKITLNYANKFDKIMLSPGPGIPSEAGNMMQIIDYFYKTKPIFGVCLGMQAIAEYFGGTIYNMKQVFHGRKLSIKVNNNDDIFKSLNHEIEVGLYHSWAVKNKNIPSDLTITAISKQDVIMGLSHKIYDIKGVQFHPESYMTKDGNKIINNWLRS